MPARSANPSRRVLALIVALLVLALLVLALGAACGGDSSPTPDPASAERPATTAPTPTPASAATAAPTLTPESAATTAPTLAPASAATTASPSADGAAKDGDLVSVHYHGTLDSGGVFDSSLEREPLQFTVGAGMVIDGFDDAVRGLAVGESVTVRLEPAEAYGERNPDLLIELPIESAPEGVEVGATLTAANGARARVVALTDTTITIDANHALAGQALTFEIELVAIGP